MEWKPDIAFLDSGLIDEGATVVDDQLRTMLDLVRRLDAGGTLVVAPAGNNASDIGAVPVRSPSVLGVTALQAELRLAEFVSGGVELAAPGVDILSVGSVADDESYCQLPPEPLWRQASQSG
jgi:subtilisin family serine protease